jgi:hypothetical protein
MRSLSGLNQDSIMRHMYDIELEVYMWYKYA